MEIAEILQSSSVIPVITIEKLEHAVPLAKALQAGGINAMEITLRTQDAIAAIKAVAQAVPNMVIGAGTIVAPQQFEQVKAAGARFAVSPGLTSSLAQAAKQAELAYLPGAVTPGEIMFARELGCKIVKFFPAHVYGGLSALQAFAPIFPDIKFCPTGGVNQENVADYLALPNVIAVGGTWLTPKTLLAEQAWEEISLLASQARQFASKKSF